MAHSDLGHCYQRSRRWQRMSKVRSLTRLGTVGVNPRTTQGHQSGLPAVCTAMGQPISSIISQAFLLSVPPWVSPSPPSSVRPSCCLYLHGSAHLLHHQSGLPAVCTSMGQPISSIISQAFLLSAPPWVSPSPSSVRNPAVCTAMGQPISSIILLFVHLTTWPPKRRRQQEDLTDDGDSRKT